MSYTPDELKRVSKLWKEKLSGIREEVETREEAIPPEV